MKKDGRGYWDLSNTKINYLNILKKEKVKNKNDRYVFKWKCLCNCGNITYVSTNYLINNVIKSCGCYKKLKGAPNKCYLGEITGSFWSSLISKARQRKIEFKITKQYAWDLFLKQNRKCSLSNIELKFEPKYKVRLAITASLDRIDSKKGYIEGNVQWVHKYINVMKNHFSQNYFINVCRLVSNYNSKILQNRNNYNYGIFTGEHWQSIKWTAKKRNIEFNIDKNYAMNLFLEQKGICLLSGQKLFFQFKPTHKNRLMKTASLDRIDNDKGYIVGNVRWIHKHINWMKMDLPDNEFLMYCNLINNNFNTKNYNE